MALLSAALPVGGQPVDPTGRLFERIKQGCEDYRHIFSASIGEADFRTEESFDRTKPADKALVRRTVMVNKIDRRSDSYLCSSETSLNKTGGRILDSCIAINGKYCFELRKWGAAKPWAIERCKITNDPDLDTRTEGFDYSYRRPSRLPAGGGAAAISAIFSDGFNPDQLQDEHPGLVIESATEDEPNHRAIVTFRYERPDMSSFAVKSQQKARAVIRSKLTLDAAQYYLPIELHQTTTFLGETHDFLISQEFVFESGVPARKTSRVRWKATAGPATLIDSETVAETRYELRPVPESDFTLSAYGFPEPRGIGGRSAPRFFWALAVGVVCTVLYIWMRRRSTRRNDFSTPSA